MLSFHQAQLLFMSRSRNHPHKSVSHIPRAVANNVINPHQFLTSQSTAARSSTIDYPSTNKLNMNSVPPSSAYFDTSNKAQTNYSKRSAQSGQSMFNPETLSSHFNYLNEVRELQGSHLDTPAPREKVPKPTPYSLPQPQPHSQKSKLW